MAICFEADQTTPTEVGQPGRRWLTWGGYMKMDEDVVPTALVLGVEIYVALVDHLCTDISRDET